MCRLQTDRGWGRTADGNRIFSLHSAVHRHDPCRYLHSSYAINDYLSQKKNNLHDKLPSGTRSDGNLASLEPRWTM